MREQEAMEPELKRLVRRGIVRHLHKKGVITRLEAEKLLEDPRLLKTPIVRNGKQATVGYCPEVWQGWS